MTEVDVMLEEICEKEEVAEQADETEKKKAKAEKQTAEKMRLKAMGESEKKQGIDKKTWSKRVERKLVML